MSCDPGWDLAHISNSGTDRGEDVRLIALLPCLLLVACGSPDDTPEAKLREWIAAMELAAEERDRAAIVDRIAEHYSDAHGNRRQDIDKTLLGYFLRRKDVTVLSTINDITVTGGSVANVSLIAAIAANSTESMNLNADAYRFELELEKAGDDWLLIGARWGQVGEDVY